MRSARCSGSAWTTTACRCPPAGARPPPCAGRRSRSTARSSGARGRSRSGRRAGPTRTSTVSSHDGAATACARSTTCAGSSITSWSTRRGTTARSCCSATSTATVRSREWLVGWRGLRPLAPGRHVLHLLRRERVDRGPHALQLESGHLPVDRLRHHVDTLLPLVRLLRQAFVRERLVRERHVHHHGGVALRRREIDEPALAEQEQARSALQAILLDVRPRDALAGRPSLERDRK